jgi:hypothetical protein
VDLWINILTFAPQVFSYRRYEIHSPSPPQVPVFLVNLTQIWQPAKTVKFSERSSCFVPNTNGHRTACTKPEICEISIIQSTPFSFGLPIFHICEWAGNEPFWTCKTRNYNFSNYRMPKLNTLTFPLSQTAIIFLGHSNSKMLDYLHFSNHPMSSTTRHDAINVLFEPFLDSALDLSVVKYIHSTKVVPKTIQNPSFADSTERKFKEHEINRTTPSWVWSLARDWELVSTFTFRCCRNLYKPLIWLCRA